MGRRSQSLSLLCKWSTQPGTYQPLRASSLFIIDNLYITVYKRSALASQATHTAIMSSSVEQIYNKRKTRRNKRQGMWCDKGVLTRVRVFPFGIFNVTDSVCWRMSRAMRLSAITTLLQPDTDGQKEAFVWPKERKWSTQWLEKFYIKPTSVYWKTEKHSPDHQDVESVLG